MDSFYSTIFVAVLALFGLLVAALIYVAQTVQDRYSTKLAERLLRGRLSLWFWFCGLVTLLLASMGSFFQAYPSGEALPLGHSISVAVHNFYYGAGTLLGVFMTLILFLLTLRRYARLLSPLTVLQEVARHLNPRTVRDIALLRLHKESPVREIGDAALRDLLDDLRGPQDEGPGTVVKPAPPSKRDAFGSALSRPLKLSDPHKTTTRPSEIEKIKNRLSAKEDTGNLEDPVGDLFEYGLSAIEKNNALAWRAFLRHLAEVLSQSTQSGYLSDDARIPFLGDALLLQGLERLTKEIEITGRYSLFLEMNDAVEQICEALMSANSWRRVFPFMKFFQDAGARALVAKDGGLFRSTVRALARIGVKSIENEQESQVFDDACRKIGWLGEKLILRGVEDSPIMPSGNETEELAEVAEGLSRLAGAIRNDKADKYPLILGDAIEVICDQALKKNEPKKVEDTILSLLGSFVDLAETLIDKESRNAGTFLWLVLTYFRQLLASRDLTNYRELRKDLYSWVGILARKTVVHNQSAGEFWGAPIPGDRDLQGLIVSFMVQMPDPYEWNAPMLDVFQKSHAHIEQAWNFIKRAGVLLGSNFGLMFDSDTGDDYGPDDPRRKHWRK